MRNSVSKNGNINYICRNCNTQRKRKYRATENGALRTRTAVYKSIKKYAERQKARMLLNTEVRKGNIKKPNYCANCQLEKKVEAHHPDYTKPLQVEWYCRSCHTLV